MVNPETQKIAYLFGAGATSAELSNTEQEDDKDKVGLSVGDVTRRVIIKAKADESFLKNDRILLDRAADSSNIELFISLIESNHYAFDDVSVIVDHLKGLVEKDIKSILTKERTDKFLLHKALLELHKYNEKEIVIGLISLNYDTVLDEAYKLYYGEPDYSFSFPKEKPDEAKPPLLKLHGSFSWDDVEINGRKRKIPIIPLGVNKNYLRLPYNFIWGRALEILIKCDKLRVIGCSLSQNDIHLIDLLFKAHLEKRAPFEIEIISSEETGQEIKGKYAFFPKITTAEKIEETLMPDAKRGINVFKEWLKAKGRRVLKEDAQIQKTTYLKEIIL